jgi:hypothetical protein
MAVHKVVWLKTKTSYSSGNCCYSRKIGLKRAPYVYSGDHTAVNFFPLQR